MTILRMVGDLPWQLSPGVSFVSNVLVSNFKSVVHFLLWVTILRLVGDHPWAVGNHPIVIVIVSFVC